MPPKHILNAPTGLMKKEGYGKGYVYDHDTPEGFSGQDYFPESMGRKIFYVPVERGFEREIQKRLSYLQKLREKKRVYIIPALFKRNCQILYYVWQFNDLKNSNG